MTPERRGEVAATLVALTFVSWDRYVEYGERLVAYGWIRDRRAGRSDFVVLLFSWDEGGMVVETITSSVERSREITRVVHGDDGGHVDCQRIHGDLLPEKGSGPQGTCSRCEGQLVRQEDGGYACPCGWAVIPVRFLEAGRR